MRIIFPKITYVVRQSGGASPLYAVRRNSPVLRFRVRSRAFVNGFTNAEMARQQGSFVFKHIYQAPLILCIVVAAHFCNMGSPPMCRSRCLLNLTEVIVKDHILLKTMMAGMQHMPRRLPETGQQTPCWYAETPVFAISTA